MSGAAPGPARDGPYARCGPSLFSPTAVPPAAVRLGQDVRCDRGVRPLARRGRVARGARLPPREGQPRRADHPGAGVGPGPAGPVDRRRQQHPVRRLPDHRPRAGRRPDPARRHRRTRPAHPALPHPSVPALRPRGSRGRPPQRLRGPVRHPGLPALRRPRRGAGGHPGGARAAAARPRDRRRAQRHHRRLDRGVRRAGDRRDGRPRRAAGVAGLPACGGDRAAAGAVAWARHGGLSVPTWLYGHEPANLFAARIAKYFSNAIREDTILRLARGGIVFAAGRAGTVQEVFQAATKAFYATDGASGPFVFLDTEFWTGTLPVEKLLRPLLADSPYGDLAKLVHVTDDVDEAVELLRHGAPATARDTQRTTP